MSSSKKLLTQVVLGGKKKKTFQKLACKWSYFGLYFSDFDKFWKPVCCFFFFVYLWQSVDSATYVACSCISDLVFRHLCAINSPKAIIASNNCVKLYTALFVFTICHTFYNLLQSCLFGGQHFTLEKACNNSLFYCVFG